MKEATAILLFARTPGAEAWSKVMTHVVRNRANVRLASLLFRHTLREIRKSGLPFYHISEHTQQGGTFGERLTHAMEQIFAHGYERIIVVGSDCPQISAYDILQASALLLEAHAVLGPATDGGMYLIGVRRSAFSASDFLDVPWQNGADCKALLKKLQTCAEKKIELLSLKRDLDNPQSLAGIINCFGTTRQLTQALGQFIKAISRVGTTELPVLIGTYTVGTPLRAPPIFIC